MRIHPLSDRIGSCLVPLPKIAPTVAEARAFDLERQEATIRKHATDATNTRDPADSRSPSPHRRIR